MWILATVAIGALVAALLLTVPVDVRFSAVANDKRKASLRIDWLYGRVGRDVEPTTSTRGSRKARRFPRRQTLDLLVRDPFRGNFMRLLQRCRRFIAVDEIRGRARFGLGDPADTGMAMGAIYPVVAWLESWPQVELRIEPDYTEACALGHVQGRIRLIPIGLLAHLALWACSPVTVRTLWRLRSL